MFYIIQKVIVEFNCKEFYMYDLAFRSLVCCSSKLTSETVLSSFITTYE